VYVFKSGLSYMGKFTGGYFGKYIGYGSGGWITVQQFWTFKNGVWNKAVKVYQYISGSWVKLWG